MIGNISEENNSGENIIYNLTQLKNRNSIIVKKNEYVYLGQALTEGSINPHNLLIVYFKILLIIIN